jgi:hypothetical protein
MEIWKKDKMYQAMYFLKKHGKHKSYMISEIEEVKKHLSEKFGLLDVQSFIKELDKRKEA